MQHFLPSPETNRPKENRPGGQSALHQHPMPIYVYVLEGEFKVQVDGSERIPVPQGQRIIEPQNRNMQVFNVGGGPGQLLVVAMGAQGQPISADPRQGGAQVGRDWLSEAQAGAPP